MIKVKLYDRALALILATLLLVSSLSTITLSQTPASYRYYGTQSHQFSVNTPSYARDFVYRYIIPIKDKDDLSKATLILGIVTRQMTYDYSALRDRASMVQANDLDNFFLTGYGICWCYSRAYVYLCREAGLRAYEIVGDAGGSRHAWAAVYINGVRYYVDPCWYDTGAPFDQIFGRSIPNHAYTYF